MPNNKQIEWQEVARRGEAQPLLFIDTLGETFLRGEFGKAHNIDWNPQYYRQVDNARWLSKTDTMKYLDLMEAAANREDDSLSDYAQEYEIRMKQTRECVDKLKQQNFSKKTDKDLAKCFKKFFDCTVSMWCFGYDYIHINKVLPNQIEQIIQQKVDDVMKQQEYLVALFEPDRLSEIGKEKRNLVKLAKQMRGKQQDFEDVESEIKDHLDKFAHLGIYYFKGSANTKKDIKERLDKYLDMDQQEFDEALKEVSQPDRNEHKTQQIINELNLNEKSVKYIEYLKHWAWLSTHADETYGYAIHHLSELWREIQNRLEINFEQLISLTGEEIIKSLRKDKLLDQLSQESKQRYQDHLIIFKEGDKNILVGEELQRYKDEHIEEKTFEDVNKLEGQVASKGSVTGKVKIVLSESDIDKVEEGDILVTDATNPTFVPAMERSAAIVAEEGGLLSHAAIVSRELNIPCLVGVNNATHILEDHDKIKMNSKDGWIKILK